ncbi:MAG TPA: iron ABC transporter permease, partial [Planctomycetota bacterium]|nr:iron ABC transporter permease [Planctomycetota bacterium]
MPGILATIGLLVIYPVFFLVTESFNTGDAGTFPPEELGVGNYLDMVSDTQVLWNTAFVAGLATVMAVGFGLLLAWILTRTAIPGRARLERLMELPYYMTPLVGALAWGVIASPKTGLANQLGRLLGINGDVLNIYSPWGIAWVMALFEGTVAFVMISAAMKSMDPSMEESARVLGAGKFRVALTVTLPMVLPGIVSATIFVFAEMLSAFAAAFVLGIPSRFIVITTVIWQSTSAYPPEYGRAAAMGLCLFVVLAVAIGLARLVLRKGSYATITGKAFRPRPLRLGARAWPLVTVCWAYLTFAVFLPMAALLMTSFQKFATVIVGDMRFTLDNYASVFRQGAVASALTNSIVLGLCVATVGSLLVGVLTWVIFRARVPGRFLVEYVVMFPQAVPRLVFGLGLLWAWLWIGQILPFTLYGTLWILGLAYLTVLLPLGVRTLAGVVLQIDKSLEECARVCGAGWAYQMRTVTLPLLRPGIVAAWLLIFISSVRELGASLFLMGPHSKVIGPAI